MKTEPITRETVEQYVRDLLTGVYNSTDKKLINKVVKHVTTIVIDYEEAGVGFENWDAIGLYLCGLLTNINVQHTDEGLVAIK
jgi:hypothetical protein